MSTVVTFDKLPKRIWYVANEATGQVTLANPNTRSAARNTRASLKLNGTTVTVGYFEPTTANTHA